MVVSTADMAQRFKNIYFVDCPGTSARERNLTLAFGEKDEILYEAVKSLTSQEIRERLGHATHQSLTASAQQQDLSINTYCLRRLRETCSPTNGLSHPELFTDLARTTRPLFDAVQATFRGGQTEPLHDWYPYLEGYSPRFVDQVLQEFAPHATSVLDPFAGTGTTPLTAARSGRAAFYSEVNPLLQFLIETKTQALTVDKAKREELAEDLMSLVDRLPQLLKDSREDAELRVAYTDVFGDSRFFDDLVYSQVLRARTLVDRTACENPLLSRFLNVAVLASLLPASRLIRRGDVRFKTKSELARGKISFESAIKKQLRILARDLRALQPVGVAPKLICEDARSLGELFPMDIDAVVTSPPYLNGTNYFRNTKLELWFLHCLRAAEDLADFRFKAITAGINDVTNAKLNGDVPLPARQHVELIRRSAYDVRIPRMIASYFREMQHVFAALRKHLTGGASLMLDIGDSAYGDVHVPTDRVLSAILRDLGYTLKREVVLRKRMSRGGFPLRQVLLVFDYHKERVEHIHDRAETTRTGWQRAWNLFKQTLPHQADNFAKRNWGNALHSLCSYQGKMKPSLAHHLVKTFVPAAGRMLDPFGGVGTIPFEASLQGITSWSFEISPAAFHIATAKLGSPDSMECDRVQTALSEFIAKGAVTEEERRDARAIRFNGPLADYFSPKTFNEVLLARKFFLLHPPGNASESLVLACLLHILHGNRPYALSRRSHPITPFAPSGGAEYRPLLPRLQDKVSRSLEEPKDEQFVPGRVFFQDATSWWPREVRNLDAIITSPPFFESTRFYLANWMRLWFCGWQAHDFRVQPLSFVDERQKRSFEIYEPIFRQARERLKTGGVMVLHLGKSRKCDMASELVKIAVRWFRVADIFTETVEHCESHGIRDKGTVTAHQFLVLN